jgi:hypothetical protein
MAEESFSPDERAELVKLVRDTIASDRYPLSPRIQHLKSVLAKLNPAPKPASERYSAPAAWVNSGIGRKRRR